MSLNEGKVFSIIGGDVEMKQGDVRTPGGIIHVVSMKAAGELGYSSSGIEVPASGFGPGKIELSERTRLDVGGGGQAVVPGEIQFTRAAPIGSPSDQPGRAGGGQVYVRGGRLVMDQSAIYQTTEGAGKGGVIDVRLDKDLIAGRGSQIVATALGSGEGGSVYVESDRLTLSERSFVETSSADGGGRGGNAVVKARKIEVFSGSQLGSDSFMSGDTGDVNLEATDVRLDSLGSTLPTSISTTSWQGGKAGNVTMDVLGKLEILNQPGGGLTGVGSRTLSCSPGPGDPCYRWPLSPITDTAGTATDRKEIRVTSPAQVWVSFSHLTKRSMRSFIGVTRFETSITLQDAMPRIWDYISRS